MDRSDVSRASEQWRSLANKGMNHQVVKKAWNLLTSCTTSNMSRRTLHNAVISFLYHSLGNFSKQLFKSTRFSNKRHLLLILIINQLKPEQNANHI